MQQKQKGLVWFRNDLRVHDNASLTQAIQENETVIAVYCFDPRHFEKDAFGFKKTEKYRAQFLIESVNELKTNLEKINISLFVYHDTPEKSISAFAKEHQINTIYFQEEWTSEEVEVSANLRTQLQTTVTFTTHYDQFLFHPDDIPYADFKKIPEVLECHYTTGNWSILIKIICRDNEHLMQLLNKKIQPIEGVSRTETFISLEQQLERQIQL